MFRHHPQKIALILSAMRKFAAGLRPTAGGSPIPVWTTRKHPIDFRRVAAPGRGIRRDGGAGDPARRMAPDRGDLEETAGAGHRLLPDDRFLCSEAEFAAWAEGRKQLRMECFYRDMRRKTGLADGG